ncbi:MAG: hypothetical protein WA614_08070 [Acidimicrobiales bacterium]
MQEHIVDPTKSVTLTHVPRDFEAEAMVGVSLSNTVRVLVGDLNEVMGKYLERFNDYERAKRDSDRSELLAATNVAYEKYLAVSVKLEVAIRDEAGIARTSAGLLRGWLYARAR